jgi:hypothetical protein
MLLLLLRPLYHFELVYCTFSVSGNDLVAGWIQLYGDDGVLCVLTFRKNVLVLHEVVVDAAVELVE